MTSVYHVGQCKYRIFPSSEKILLDNAVLENIHLVYNDKRQESNCPESVGRAKGHEGEFGGNGIFYILVVVKATWYMMCQNSSN